MNKDLKRFHFIILAIAVIVYSVTAIHSLGYYHWDEQYQILEFGNLKLGLSQAYELAWEYEAGIRPAVQPAIYVLIARAAGGFGFKDPYLLTLITRALSMILTLIAIRTFIFSVINSISLKFRKLFIGISYLLWFLPFLSVRFSSESWSGIFLLFSIALIIKASSSTGKNLLYAGVFIGLAFIFRFQTAFCSLGLLAYTYFIAKHSLSKIVMMSVAACVVVLLGLAVDFWFYEKVTLSAWNYFEVNILQGTASQFGTSPWYFYFEGVLTRSILPFGLIIWLFTAVLLLKRPKHVVIWVILPYLLVHVIIPHKELRFMFPLALLVPIILITGMEEVLPYFNKFFTRQRVVYLTFGICLFIINVFALTVMAFRPMNNGYKVLTSYIYHYYPNQKTTLICERLPNPYNPLRNIKENTYKDENINVILKDEFIIGSTQVNPHLLFICSKDTFDFPENQQIIEKYDMTLKAQSIPSWVEAITHLFDNKENTDILLLYGTD